MGTSASIATSNALNAIQARLSVYHRHVHGSGAKPSRTVTVRMEFDAGSGQDWDPSLRRRVCPFDLLTTYSHVCIQAETSQAFVLPTHALSRARRSRRARQDPVHVSGSLLKDVSIADPPREDTTPAKTLLMLVENKL